MAINIHISDVRSFKACRTRWGLSSGLQRNLEPKRPNRHLWLGRGVHYALAAYYGSPERDPRALSNAWEAWVLREMAALAEVEMTPQQQIELEDSADMGSGVLNHYLRWARTVDDFKVVMPETRFRVPIPLLGDGVELVGTADGVIQMPNGDYFLLEHKTAAQMPRQWSNLFFDEQCMAYLWATQEDDRFPRGIKGVVYNFLRKKIPTVPRLLKSGLLSTAKNQDTTPETFIAEAEAQGHPLSIYEDYIRLLRAKENTFFVRATVPHQLMELYTWFNHFQATVLEMLDENTVLYPSPGPLGWQCASCPFKVPCEFLNTGVPKEQLDFVLSTDFQSRSYDAIPEGPDTE